jgi:two-component system OmpR family sensor kinase
MGLPHAFGTRVEWLSRSAAARRVGYDVLLVLVAVAVVAAACPPLEHGLPPARVAVVLALLAAAGATAAAFLAVLAVRLTADHHIGGLGRVLGCYGLLVIPTTMIDTLDIAPALTVGAMHFVAQCVVVTSLVPALIASDRIASDRMSGLRTVRAVVGGAALIAAGGQAAIVFPAAVQAITMSPLSRAAIALAWSGLAIAIAVRAAKLQTWAQWQVGAGLVLLGIVEAGWPGADVSPTAELGLGVSCIRLVAVGLVLRATLHLVREALERLADEQTAHEEELRLAEIRLAHTAERDHELRNGIAGLAGATTVMGADRADPRLTSVVAAELCRLDELLRAPGGHRRPVRTTTYAVAPALSGLVVLREVAGMDIQLDTDQQGADTGDTGLCAIGSSSVLAQVVTNLIGNAERHAPGSPVRLSAFRDGDEIVIHVRDFGPGVPPGREEAVFEPRVRDGRAAGTGLGLHICRRLIEAEGGSIAVSPWTPERVGCTVCIRLPAADARHTFVPADVWCNAS